jgi:hypothetical protein
MKLSTISDYMNLIDVCPFCGDRLTIELRGKQTPDFRPTYRMDFSQTHWMPQQLYLKGMLEDEGPPSHTMRFVSDLQGNALGFYYVLNGTKHRILSINITNNKVEGDLDKVQRVVWDHRLTLARGCPHLEIDGPGGNSYVNTTLPLLLERKKSVIMPLWMDLEAFTIRLHDKPYMLGTHYSGNRTSLFSLEDRNTVVDLPLMNLHAMRDKEAITNKIQTMLVFG